MAKEQTVSLSAEESEQKIRSLLGPWLFRMFRLKSQQKSIDDRESVMGYPYATQERAARERQLLWDKQMIRGAWEAEIRSFPQLTNELSSIIQQTNELLIEGIKVFSKAFLLEYRRIMGRALGWKDSEWMPDEELKDLADLAVFTYLELWLDQDRKSYLPIEQFVKYGYGGTGGEPGNHEDYDNWKATLHRAYATYEDMYMKGQLQKKERSEITHPVHYKRENKRELSLLDLAWCEAWASKKIDILDLLFFQKSLRNRKSAHDAAQNKRLKVALNRYAQFVDEIRDSYPTDEKQIDQYKAYLSRCILVQRLERAYRFSLAGYLADYAVESGCRPDAYNKELLSAYIGTHQDESGMLIISKKLLGEDGNRKYKKSFSPYRTLGYEEIAEMVFEASNPEQIKHAYDAEVHRRVAMDNLIEMLSVCCPFEQRPWNDEDFRAAAAFLGNEYQFLDRLTVWDLPVQPGIESQWNEGQKATEKNTQKFCDYYYAYYLRLYEDEQTQTKWIVQELTKKKKNGKKTT